MGKNIDYGYMILLGNSRIQSAISTVMKNDKPYNGYYFYKEK